MPLGFGLHEQTSPSSTVAATTTRQAIHEATAVQPVAAKPTNAISHLSTTNSTATTGITTSSSSSSSSSSPSSSSSSSSSSSGMHQLQQITWDELDKTKYYVIGPTVFLGVRAAVYPSNLVKTRIQVQSKSKPLYNGTFDAFKQILRHEGFRGLYKGFSASILNVCVGNVYISVYEVSRKLCLQHTQTSERIANFIGGASASVVSQTIIVPLDIVTQRMMISDQGVRQKNSRERARGFWSMTKNIYRLQGFRGFYKGYLASIVTYAPASAIWWGAYGIFVPVVYDKMQMVDMDPFWRQVTAQAISGGSAGIVTAITTNPMDYIRTRAQIYTKYNAWATAQYVLQREGLRGFMTGVTARVLSMGPSGVLVVTSYEFVKRLSRKQSPLDS